MEDLSPRSVPELVMGLCELYAKKCEELDPLKKPMDAQSLFRKAFEKILFSNSKPPVTPEDDELATYMRWIVFYKRRSRGNSEDLQKRFSECYGRLENLGSSEYEALLKFLLYIGWATDMPDVPPGEIEFPDIPAPTLGEHAKPCCTPFTRSTSLFPNRLPPPLLLEFSRSFSDKRESFADAQPLHFDSVESKSSRTATGSETGFTKPYIEDALFPERRVTLRQLISAIKRLMTGHESVCFHKVEGEFKLRKGVHTEDLGYLTLLRCSKHMCLAGNAYERFETSLTNETVEPLFVSSLARYLLNYATNVMSTPLDMDFPKFFMCMNHLSTQIRQVRRYVRETDSGAKLVGSVFRGVLESSKFSRNVFQQFLLELCNTYYNMIDLWVFRGICHPQFFVEKKFGDEDIVDRDSFMRAFVLKGETLPIFLSDGDILKCGRNVFLLSLIAKNEFARLLDLYKEKPKMELALNNKDLEPILRRWDQFSLLYQKRSECIFEFEKRTIDHGEMENIRQESSRIIIMEKETEDKRKHFKKIMEREMKEEDLARSHQVIRAKDVEDKILQMAVDLEQKIKSAEADERERRLGQEVAERYAKESKLIDKQKARNEWKLKRGLRDQQESSVSCLPGASTEVFVPQCVEASRNSASSVAPLTAEFTSKRNLAEKPVEISEEESLVSQGDIETNLNLTFEPSQRGTEPSPACSNASNPSDSDIPLSTACTDFSEPSLKEAPLETHFFKSLPSLLELSLYESSTETPPEVASQVSSPGDIFSCLFASVSKPLKIQNDYVQWLLLKVFTEDFLVYDHFKSIKEHFFLGLFCDNFTNSVYRLVEKNVDARTFIKAVHNILEKTSCPRLSFRYEGATTAETLDLTQLKLTYITDWPLNLIVTDACVKKYTIIFEMCWLLNRTTWHLNDCRRRFCMRPSIKGNEIVQVSIHLHCMKRFTETLSSYLSIVFENAWRNLTAGLKEAKGLDRLYQLHVSYIKEILFSALLNRKASKLFAEITNALDTIVRYCRIICHESEWILVGDGDAGGEHRNSKFPKLSKIYSAFLKLVEYIRTFVVKATKRAGYEQLIFLKEMLS